MTGRRLGKSRKLRSDMKSASAQRDVDPVGHRFVRADFDFDVDVDVDFGRAAALLWGFDVVTQA